MPEINIEEKIQEALKRKSFKDNKLEYLGLSLVFCLMLYITYVVSYFIPFLGIFVFFLIDIPLLMGFKHFIWFGPASGETLIDGFKVSLICGYLNFFSYIKIFITTNLKPFLFGILGTFASVMVGSFVVEGLYSNEISAIRDTVSSDANYAELANALMENEALNKAIYIMTIVSLVVGFLVYYLVKLRRAIIPYVSFLRLTSLDGKSMEGVLTHTKKVLYKRTFKFYLKSTLVHLLYFIPVGVSILVYFLMSRNPVYSNTTIQLITSLSFFVTMFPALLFIELNYRNFCIEVNQEYLKEHKKMLNDALNDLDKSSK